MFCIGFYLYRKIATTIRIDSGQEWQPAVKVSEEETAAPEEHGTPTADGHIGGTDIPEPDSIRPSAKRSKKVYGLVGKSLGHSYSERYFTDKFNREGTNACYVNFEMDDVAGLRNLFESRQDICGLNVTVPYKTEVIRLLDRLDEKAKAIGAVNVIKPVRSDGRLELVGYNTDADGFEHALRPLLPDFPVKALILGTGGAAKAVKFVLDRMGIESKSVSRTSSFDNLGYYELSPSVMDSHLLIVNCTPVGMSPDISSCPEIPYANISPEHILFDLVYNPETTLFLKKGIEHGAKVTNGLDMLYRQAEESWKIWNE